MVGVIGRREAGDGGWDEISKYPENGEEIGVFYCLALKNGEEIRNFGQNIDPCSNLRDRFSATMMAASLSHPFFELLFWRRFILHSHYFLILTFYLS